MELVHGGDWAGYRARFGHDALDFSANVSPLGLPQGVADAIVAALPTVMEEKFDTERNEGAKNAGK